MKNITVSPSTTIKEAMERLDRTAEKVLLVVNDAKKLIGTLTDGDIRRYILRGEDLCGTILEAFHRNPTYIFKEDFDIDRVREDFLSKKIDLIPILDKNYTVLDTITWESAFGNSRKSKNKMVGVPVVIMAGGKGTRLEPFTRVLPKPLIPIGDKPVIDHIIDRFRAYGANEFYLTLHYMSKIIKAYFEDKKLDYSIGFAEEDKPLGTAGSLKLLNDKLDRPFFVSNCDIVIETDYNDLYNFHVRNNYEITLVASAKQIGIPYGVCELNGLGRLEEIKEKPVFNFLVNAGMYVLNPDVLKLIPDKQTFHITHLIAKLNKKEGRIGVYPVSEKSWIEIGQWEEYRKSMMIFT